MFWNIPNVFNYGLSICFRTSVGRKKQFPLPKRQKQMGEAVGYVLPPLAGEDGGDSRVSAGRGGACDRRWHTRRQLEREFCSSSSWWLPAGWHNTLQGTVGAHLPRQGLLPDAPIHPPYAILPDTPHSPCLGHVCCQYHAAVFM